MSGVWTLDLNKLEHHFIEGVTLSIYEIRYIVMIEVVKEDLWRKRITVVKIWNFLHDFLNKKICFHGVLLL